MKRRSFLSLLGATALTPLLPKVAPVDVPPIYPGPLIGAIVPDSFGMAVGDEFTISCGTWAGRYLVSNVTRSTAWSLPNDAGSFEA